MSLLTVIVAAAVGVLVGYFTAALMFIAREPKCETCVDAAKANSWDRTVEALERMGEPVVSPRVIADLAREALAHTRDPLAD